MVDKAIEMLHTQMPEATKEQILAVAYKNS